MTISIENSGPVRTIIHDRYEARNAMDPDSAVALHQALLDFDADESASVAVLWGAGGAFCAGWDLKYAGTLVGADDPLAPLNFIDGTTAEPRGPMGPTRLVLSKPVIAAIEGPAVAGGMEIALWCDLRVMARDAFMGVYCRRWGVPLIDGGTIRLPRIVGRGRALDMILTGRKVPAEECMQIGLCERLVEPGDARQAAEELAQSIARFPQRCMRADRASVYAHSGVSIEDGLKGEFYGGKEVLAKEGVEGAARFASGKGRHGNFEDI
jgi:enoyl-CoA hydratase